jgi:hypothetical protein
MAENRDKPLADTPTPIIDMQGVFADIEKRSKERTEAKAASQKKVNDARNERRNKQGPTQTGPSKLLGLASFADRTKLT